MHAPLDPHSPRLRCGAVRLARAAREAAVNYTNQREPFGQKIGQFQMNQDLIAQMIVQEEAARLRVSARHLPRTVADRITLQFPLPNMPPPKLPRFVRTPR